MFIQNSHIFDTTGTHLSFLSLCSSVLPCSCHSLRVSSKSQVPDNEYGTVVAISMVVMVVMSSRRGDEWKLLQRSEYWQLIPTMLKVGKSFDNCIVNTVCVDVSTKQQGREHLQEDLNTGLQRVFMIVCVHMCNFHFVVFLVNMIKGLAMAAAVETKEQEIKAGAKKKGFQNHPWC